MQNKQWRLSKPVVGMIGPEHFEKSVVPVPQVQDGEVLFKVLYLSFDPAQRSWLNKGSYMKQVVPGDVMLAQGLCVCVESKNAKFQAGDLAVALCGWQEYFLSKNGKGADKLPAMPKGLSPTLALSLFGTTGLTAYFGLLEVGKMKKGDVVLVSGAAGSTGSVVGQIAKIKGASKVIGIAGGKAKCDYCLQIGYDAVVDYRDTSVPLHKQLKKVCPKGIDVFFDNVGGEALDAALLLVRKGARIALCGGISQYNPKGTNDLVGPKNYLSMIGTGTTMKGFLVMEFVKQYKKGFADLAQWYQQGLLQQKEDIRTGFDNIPTTLQGLYTSQNFGKLLLSLDNVPSKL